MAALLALGDRAAAAQTVIPAHRIFLLHIRSGASSKIQEPTVHVMSVVKCVPPHCDAYWPITSRRPVSKSFDAHPKGRSYYTLSDDAQIFHSPLRKPEAHIQIRIRHHNRRFALSP